MAKQTVRNNVTRTEVPPVVTEVPTWQANGLPSNDAAKAIVSEWQQQYADAKSNWSKWDAAAKLAYAVALATQLDSAYDGDMSDKRSLGGYIRLSYSETAFRFTRCVTCGDATLPTGLRQWVADMGKALRDSDSVALATLKPSDGSNATYVAIGQFVQRRNMPTVVVWPTGSNRASRKLGGTTELKLD